MSIVLVIIGLVIAGITVGQTMKRSSELQSIITDEAKYVEDARQFKEKYAYLPGDLPTATNYWGVETPNGCPDLGPWSSTPLQATGTCNGNGDGFINSDGTGYDAPYPMFETWRAWQQMAYAGFVEGTFTGTPYSDCYTNGMPGVNEPAAKIANVAFEWNYYSPAYTLNALNGGVVYTGLKNYTQYMLIGSSVPYGCGSPDLPFMTPAEAKALDGKVDDGMPTTGKWIAGDYTGECITPESQPNVISIYNTTGVAPYYESSFNPSKQVCAWAVEVDW